MTDLISGAASLSAALKARGIPVNITFHTGDDRMTLRLHGDQAEKLADLLIPGINDNIPDLP